MRPVVEPLIKSNKWSRGLGASTPMSENLTFISNAASITPLITLSSGSPVWAVQESDGKVYNYYTAGFTHNRVAAGNMRVELCNTEAIKNLITRIDFNGNGIISPFWDLRFEKFSALTHVYLHNNSLIGNLSSWLLPSSLIALYIHNNSLTGNLSSWLLPSSLAYAYLSNNSFIGDLSSWVLPSSLIELRIQLNSFIGDLSSWIVPGVLISIYVADNNFTGAPTITVGSSALQTYLASNNKMLQPALDQIANEFYTNRMNFTATTPTIDISSNTGSPPSGIYQYANPPVTQLEKVHWLVNDTTEGFNNHAWTY